MREDLSTDPTPSSNTLLEKPAQTFTMVPGPAFEAREILFSIHAWIERSDSKASILAAVFVAALAAELTTLEHLVRWLRAGSLRWIVLIPACVSLVAVLAAGALAAASIYPRLGPRYQYRQGLLSPGDLVYFGRLRKIPPEEIASGLERAVAEETMVYHFAEQIHMNSNIAWRKQQQLQWAIRALAVGAMVAVVGFVVWISLR